MSRIHQQTCGKRLQKMMEWNKQMENLNIILKDLIFGLNSLLSLLMVGLVSSPLVSPLWLGCGKAMQANELWLSWAYLSTRRTSALFPRLWRIEMCQRLFHDNHRLTQFHSQRPEETFWLNSSTEGSHLQVDGMGLEAATPDSSDSHSPRLQPDSPRKPLAGVKPLELKGKTKPNINKREPNGQQAESRDFNFLIRNTATDPMTIMTVWLSK